MKLNEELLLAAVDADPGQIFILSTRVETNRNLVVRTACVCATVGILGAGFCQRDDVCDVALLFVASFFDPIHVVDGMEWHRNVATIPLNCSSERTSNAKLVTCMWRKNCSSKERNK